MDQRERAPDLREEGANRREVGGVPEDRLAELAEESRERAGAFSANVESNGEHARQILDRASDRLNRAHEAIGRSLERLSHAPGERTRPKST